MSILLSTLNQSIQRALQYDVTSQQKLENMQGRSMTWVITDLSITLSFRVDSGRLCLLDQDVPAQVRVVTNVSEIISLMRTDSVDSANNLSLKIEGNVLTLQEFQQLFKNLSIDWEALLEDCVGDFNAQMIVRSKSIGKQIFNDVCSGVQNLLSPQSKKTI